MRLDVFDREHPLPERNPCSDRPSLARDAGRLVYVKMNSLASDGDELPHSQLPLHLCDRLPALVSDPQLKRGRPFRQGRNLESELPLGRAQASDLTPRQRLATVEQCELGHQPSALRQRRKAIVAPDDVFTFIEVGAKQEQPFQQWLPLAMGVPSRELLAIDRRKLHHDVVRALLLNLQRGLQHCGRRAHAHHLALPSADDLAVLPGLRSKHHLDRLGARTHNFGRNGPFAFGAVDPCLADLDTSITAATEVNEAELVRLMVRHRVPALGRVPPIPRHVHSERATLVW